jgi:CAAX prenyl protease-like protein
MSAPPPSEAAEVEEHQAGHGWWPYLLPLFSFLAIVEFGGALPASAAGWLLPLKVAVPLGFTAFFLAQGRYPELRGYRPTPRMLFLDVAVGVAGAALWVAPYVIDRIDPFLPFAWLRPEEGGFDPNLYGASLAGFAVALRTVGYGIVTPFAEELFARSFLCRYAEVFDGGGDFRRISIGHRSARGFAAVVIYFAISHVLWELPVALAWAALTQLWLYHRRHLMALVVVHAASNLSIVVFALTCSGWLTDPSGLPIDLWFFV